MSFLHSLVPCHIHNSCGQLFCSENRQHLTAKCQASQLDRHWVNNCQSSVSQVKQLKSPTFAAPTLVLVDNSPTPSLHLKQAPMLKVIRSLTMNTICWSAFPVHINVLCLAFLPLLDYSILLSLTMAVTMDSLGFSSLFRSALSHSSTVAHIPLAAPPEHKAYHPTAGLHCTCVSSHVSHFYPWSLYRSLALDPCMHVMYWIQNLTWRDRTWQYIALNWK